MGFIGQIAPVKGLTQLLEALSPIPGRWQLAIAGRDPSPGARYELECREYVSRLGFENRIRFLGFCDNTRMFYEAVDVVAIPSLEEPLARVLYEAYAHARPVVAYATGGLPEAIHQGETGWLVPRGNIEQLRERLRAFIEQPNKTIGLAAYEWVKDVASPKIYTAKVVDFYGLVRGLQAAGARQAVGASVSGS